MTPARKVLLLHKDNKQSTDIAQGLTEEGYIVLGPFKTTADAYISLLKEEPHYAIIDSDISSEKTNTLSNTLIQLKIEHLVLLNDATQIMKRRLNYGAIKGILTTSFLNIVTGICSELRSFQTASSPAPGRSNDKDKIIV